MSVEINGLLVRSPEIRHGRPRIAGTGITVHRVAIWYRLGHSPEEIADQYEHLTVAQVYAALAYYHSNQAEIEAEIAADEAEGNDLKWNIISNFRPRDANMIVPGRRRHGL